MDTSDVLMIELNEHIRSSSSVFNALLNAMFFDFNEVFAIKNMHVSSDLSYLI